MKFLIIANCQGAAIKAIIQSSRTFSADHLNIHFAEPMDYDTLNGYDAIIAQDIRPDRKDFWESIRGHPNIFRFPWLIFDGFTPDFVHMIKTESDVLGHAPRIVAAAKVFGLTKEEIKTLYTPEFIEMMGYRESFGAWKKTFLENLSKYTTEAEYYWGKWMERGVFFYTGNHPKFFVIRDIVLFILKDAGIILPDIDHESYFPDPLMREAIYPNLNHSDNRNSLETNDHFYKLGNKTIFLPEMIDYVFKHLRDGQVRDVDLERFGKAHELWQGKKTHQISRTMASPYSGRPPYTFWRKSISDLDARDVRPGSNLFPVIDPATRVATAGSCFAQHVAKAMVKLGLNYYVPENAPKNMPKEEAKSKGYGLFSVRCGNVYTVRQLLQLFDRAYGTFDPVEIAWQVDGGYVDPFRPNIGEIFADVLAVESSRREHLSRAKEMFEGLDVFIFTLGLTEGWVDRRDGAVFPIAPGAVAKFGNESNYGFENFSYRSIKDDLISFIGRLKSANSRAKIILTVSPVPLVATYEDDHVLSATTYSKSSLRLVAGDVATLFDFVQYFPSYEIISGNFNRGDYFEDNLRTVRQRGVDHVMEIFQERLVTNGAKAGEETLDERTAYMQTTKEIEEEIAERMNVVCDEEVFIQDS